ncbi:Gfo/Idh/MocA family oxidoreductase [Rariglobus hedericola]|uniref:Gfo/Idh/MocA family oxidoreductase n=1 Tax=Rariglobus hedericola TaxID=2597822 RepID=A0A556QJJ1_9BACT|nr:Gfo/Idh/MocA family oxidoreductase [Rariglobus hedericola]TSJ76792.1 Gfo/Idh/MocA family oxidoreductase [Rariglobus hedericola]
MQSSPSSSSSKQRYALVGTGGRAPMFLDPIADTYRDSCELVGLCDISATRLAWHQQRLALAYGTTPPPAYAAADFDRMIAEQKPDTVIVCTPDYTHHEYIVRALDAGCDVISEKPLTTSADNYTAISDAVRRSGRTVRTTFNYRWGIGATTVRRLIAEGAIGKVKHVDFEYMLNTSHGADYFRRWHSYKKYSGGLLVHKSTHHFDLVNWWIDAIPDTVFAMGDLVFYGKDNAVARGQEALTAYPRYTGEPKAAGDPFRFDLQRDPTLKALYLDAEADSGYLRDQNVFREGIDIEDTMSVMVRYRTGAMLSYSLNAFCPCEGFRVSITGDAGRIEYVEEHASHIITGDRDIKIESHGDEPTRLTLHPLFEAPRRVPIPKVDAPHGGGDPLIQEQIFSAHPPADPFRRGAGHEQGAASLLIGAAANRALATGQPVRIADIAELKSGARHLSQLI